MQDLEEGIVAIDLGSSQIKVVIGRVIDQDQVEIIGTGIAIATGIKNGAIINIENTGRAISEAVQNASLVAGQDISAAIVNISGKTIRSLNEKGVVAITNKDRIVTDNDVKRVIEAAYSIKLPSDQEILHVLSKEFSVDEQTNIKEPLGMTGVRLEAEVHIVTAGITAISNLDRCLDVAGIQQLDKVLSCFASSEAVLTTSEKEMGVAVVDIGAGITDIVLYIDGGVTYSSVVPLGGNNITSDIAIGLKVNTESAEIIKRKYANVLAKKVDPTEKIDLPPVGGKSARTALKQDLAKIIEPRVREIIELVNAELEKSGKKPFLAGGVILTGGTSLIEGIDILAEEIFELSVGRAKPAGVSGLIDKVASPEYSTAVGLIKYAARSFNIGQTSSEKKATHKWNDNTSSANPEKVPITKKIWRWVENNL